jgi:predicted Zn-dependent protease
MIAVLVLTLVLAAGAAQAGQAPTQAQAIELAKQGKHEAALSAFQQLAADNPGNIDARIWIGRMHAEMGHPDWAEPVFRSVILDDPQNVEATIGLSDALVSQRRNDEALVALSKVATAQPPNPEISAAIRRARGPRFPGALKFW